MEYPTETSPTDAGAIAWKGGSHFDLALGSQNRSYLAKFSYDLLWDKVFFIWTFFCLPSLHSTWQCHESMVQSTFPRWSSCFLSRGSRELTWYILLSAATHDLHRTQNASKEVSKTISGSCSIIRIKYVLPNCICMDTRIPTPGCVALSWDSNNVLSYRNLYYQSACIVGRFRIKDKSAPFTEQHSVLLKWKFTQLVIFILW